MNAARKIIFATLLLFIGLSCTKDDGYVENPNEQGLTPCPADFYCEYSYADNSDFSNAYGEVSKGNFRVFWNVMRGSTLVYLKVPMKGDDFYINNSTIQKDIIKFNNQCPTCYSANIEYKVTGGFSKGKKLKDLSGKEKWLLETKLFITVVNTDYKDTLYLKQYYYQKLQNN